MTPRERLVALVETTREYHEKMRKQLREHPELGAAIAEDITRFAYEEASIRASIEDEIRKEEEKA